MEKVNGGTLEQFIIFNKKQNKIKKIPVPPGKKLKPLNEEVAASIAKDICNGLFAIHKKNFIHRDLKPENILIDESEDEVEPQYTAKIADFGLSAEVHSNVFHGQDNINEVMGTILFMAPE
jgi:serine/threonine protein kinase